MATIAGAAKGMSVFVYLRATADQFAADMEKAAKTAKNHAKDFKAVGESLTKYVTLPLTAIGGAAVYAAVQIDKGLDTIRVGTGATGKQMEGLEKTFKAVFKAVPTDAEKAGTAIAELNTRTGLTGKALEDLAKQELELARITGEDLKGQIQASTRVFGDWSIATESQGAAMDYMFKTSQATGIGFTDLNNKLVQFGAPLRQLGFDFETSAALLGKFHKEGVNTELVMGSMRIALGQMAREGITDANVALQTIVDRIKSAGTASQANAIALEMFGARAGPDMAAAIREGRFEVNQLVTDLKKNKETILAAAKATKDFQERWTESINKIIVAIEPVGRKILDILDQKVIPVIEKAAGVLETLCNWFSSLSDTTQTTIIVLGGVALAAGPVILAISGIYSSVASLLPLLSSARGGITNLAGALTGAGEAGFKMKAGIIGAAVALAAWSLTRSIQETQDLVNEQKNLRQLLDEQPGFWDRMRQSIFGVSGAIEDSTRTVRIWQEAWKAWKEDGLNGVIDALTSVENHTKSLSDEIDRLNQKAASDSAYAKVANKLWDENKAKLQGILPEYELLRHQLDTGKISQEKFNQEFDRLRGVVTKITPPLHTTAQDIAEITKQSEELRKKWQTGWMEKGAKAAEEMAAEVQRLTTSFQNQIRPADDLQREIQTLLDRGFSKEQIVAVWGERISKVAAEHERMNGVVHYSVAELWAMNTQLEIGALKPIPMATDAIKQFGLATSTYGTPEVEKLTKAAVENAGKANEMGSVWSSQISTIRTDLGKGAADILMTWGDWGSKFVNLSKQILGSVVRMFTETFAGGLMKGIGGLLGGQGAGGFSLSNMFGGSGGIGGWLGKIPGLGFLAGGGGAAATLPALGGFMPGATMAIDGLSLPILGGGSGAAAGGAGGGMMGSLGAFLTNPFTMGIGGGLAAFLAYQKWIKKDAYKSGGKEFGRDLGMDVSAKTIEQFVGSLGVSKKSYEGIRADIQWSPKMLQEVLLPQAIQQGPAAVEALIQKYSQIKTVMGNADWSEAVRKAVETGAWQDLNEQYNTLFSKSNALVAAMPDFASKLAAVTDEAAEAAAKFWELDDYTKALVEDFAMTGVMSDDLRSKLQGLSGVDAALLESQGAEIASLRELQGEFGQLQEYLAGLIPPVDTAIDRFLKTGEITQELRDQVANLGGDITKFEAFARLTQEAQAAEMSLSEYIATNANAAQVAKDLAGELDTLQNSLGAKIEAMVEKFTTAIDALIEALGNVTPAAEAAANAVADVPSALAGETVEPAEKEELSGGGSRGGKGRIPKYATGGWVKKSGLAIVDAGELILPGAMASRAAEGRPPASINFTWNSPPVTINGATRETADDLVDRFQEIIETNKKQIMTELTRRVSDMMRTELA